MTGYEAFLDDVIDKLETTIKDCASFTSDSVHLDYVRTEDYGSYDPICLVALQRDELDASGPQETEHSVQFNLRVKHTGTGAKSDLLDIVSYVGEIVDEIDGDRTIGSLYVDVDGTEVTNVEYSMSEQGGGVIYWAYMTISIRGHRTLQ